MSEKNYNAKRDSNPSQICRKFGSGVFIEIIQPNDSFERVIVNLVSLNKNNTQKCMISTYIDMDEFVTLCTRISTGRFGKKLELTKKYMSPTSFPPEVWKRQGGKEGPNGAWMLSIHPATKGDCLIQARRGAGEKLSNGLIKFIYSKTNEVVMISLTHDVLEDIANISLMRIQAYITSRQIRGLYDYDNSSYRKQSEEAPFYIA